MAEPSQHTSGQAKKPGYRERLDGAINRLIEIRSQIEAIERRLHVQPPTPPIGSTGAQGPVGPHTTPTLETLVENVENWVHSVQSALNNLDHDL